MQIVKIQSGSVIEKEFNYIAGKFMNRKSLITASLCLAVYKTENPFLKTILMITHINKVMLKNFANDLIS